MNSGGAELFVHSIASQGALSDCCLGDAVLAMYVLFLINITFMVNCDEMYIISQSLIEQYKVQNNILKIQNVKSWQSFVYKNGVPRTNVQWLESLYPESEPNPSW